MKVNANGGAEAFMLVEIYLYERRNRLWLSALQVIGGFPLTREKWSSLLRNLIIGVIQSYSQFYMRACCHFPLHCHFPSSTHSILSLSPPSRIPELCSRNCSRFPSPLTKPHGTLCYPVFIMPSLSLKVLALLCWSFLFLWCSIQEVGVRKYFAKPVTTRFLRAWWFRMLWFTSSRRYQRGRNDYFSYYSQRL